MNSITSVYYHLSESDAITSNGVFPKLLGRISANKKGSPTLWTSFLASRHQQKLMGYENIPDFLHGSDPSGGVQSSQGKRPAELKMPDGVYVLEIVEEEIRPFCYLHDHSFCAYPEVSTQV